MYHGVNLLDAAGSVKGVPGVPQFKVRKPLELDAPIDKHPYRPMGPSAFVLGHLKASYL